MFKSCTRILHLSTIRGPRVFYWLVPEGAFKHRCAHLWTLSVSRYPRNIVLLPIPTLQPNRSAKGKASGEKKKEAAPVKVIELDSDVCNGANILKSGSDPPLKPDSEYPDWLWNLAELGDTPKSPSELSPDSKQYWRRYNKVRAHERNTLQEQFGKV